MAGSSSSGHVKALVHDVLNRVRTQPFTSLAIAFLVLIPLTSLWLSDQRSGNESDSSPNADPLLHVSEGMQMVQSFRVDAAKPVPALWTKLFDPKTASELWQQLDEQIWWQAWPQEGDALLILPETSVVLPSATASLRREIEGFTLVFADLLNAVTFDQQARSSNIVPSPLEARCFQYLRKGSAVLWSPAALASMAGPMLPLLQSASYGCFSLELKGTLLSWSGVVGSRPLRQASKRLAPPDQPAEIPSLNTTASKPVKPSSAKQSSSKKTTSKTPTSKKPSSKAPSTKKTASAAPLLEMSSSSSRSLLGAMLNRPLIRDGLEEDYGLPPTLQLELLDAPLFLKVIQVDQGPFLAGVQLDLQLPADTKALVSALNSAAEKLKEGGLQRREKKLISPNGRSAGRAVLWFEKHDEKERLLGGWTLINADDAKKHPAQLRLTLATSPHAKASASASGTALPQDPVQLILSMQPNDLEQLGLFGSSWPRPVRLAKQLNLILQPLAGSATSHEDWSWMRGQLAVP